VELYPAIDLLGGRCVRLLRGRLDDVTVYDTDPVGRAETFAAAGASWVHVVDLDSALGTGGDNWDVVAAIAAAVPIKVQAGGGLRDAASVAAALDAGVARVVLGTVALESPELIARLATRWPGRIAAAVDARDGEVAVRGWVDGSGVDDVFLARRLQDAGVAALLATEVSRDGTMAGPDFAGIGRLLAAVSVPVLASGGVGSAQDLARLAALEVAGRRPAGAVVGKAIYEGVLDVSAAVRMLGEVEA
jgi:phosphoribosylformimino-5-aminoimidazole carboxamide ribotide isomerase